MGWREWVRERELEGVRGRASYLLPRQLDAIDSAAVDAHRGVSAVKVTATFPAVACCLSIVIRGQYNTP